MQLADELLLLLSYIAAAESSKHCIKLCAKQHAGPVQEDKLQTPSGLIIPLIARRLSSTNLKQSCASSVPYTMQSNVSEAVSDNFVSFSGFRGTTLVPILSEPHKKPTSKSVPKVDFANSFSDSLSDRICVAQDVRRALHEARVFYAANHGVPQARTERLHKASLEFFALPEQEKMSIHESKSGFKRGYLYSLEGRDDDTSRHDFRECFKMVADPHEPESGFKSSLYKPGHPNLWPKDLPEFRKYVIEYNTAMRVFAEKLIQILALALGADENALDHVTNPFSGLSVLRYPPYREGASDGRGVHTDYSLFTILTQLSPVTSLNHSGHWVSAPPVPGTLVINIGDFLQRLSNDVFSSTIYRVVNRASVERYSVAYFFDADPEAWIEPLRTEVSRNQGGWLASWPALFPKN